MRTFEAIAHLKSLAPYSQSKMVTVDKKERESHDDYEKRTWREKSHYDSDGRIIMPSMSFKFAVADAAKFLSEKIPGKRNATWTKHFEAGVLCVENVVLPDHKDSVQGETYFMNSDGVRGSGKRVPRTFPVIPSWEADVKFLIIDATITEDAFKRHLEAAGRFIGVGRFRPRQGGFYGRFEVVSLEWREEGE